jgi:hypothetical protein
MGWCLSTLKSWFRKLATASFVLLALSGSVQAGEQTQTLPEHLCLAEEKVLFACQEGKRRISICGSPGLSRQAGYVQFRYGVPGSEDMIAWPEASFPRRHVIKGNVLMAGKMGVYFRFRMEDTSFVVYHVRDVQAGLVISSGGMPVSKRRCDRVSAVAWSDVPVPVGDGIAVSGVAARKSP